MPIEDYLYTMRRQGYCLIEGVIPADRVAAIKDSVLATVERYRHLRTDAPKDIGAVSGLINYDRSFAPYLTEERLWSLCSALLGQEARISYTSSVVNWPGNQRGPWHADWPFNQSNAGHIPQPYPDAVFHLTTLWMLTPFTAENGATLAVPGSHLRAENPSGGGIDPVGSLAGEMQLCGAAGTVAVLDSRLWHATAANCCNGPRVGMAIRYAPWWLNLELLRPGSDERRRMVDERGLRDNQVPAVSRQAYEDLPPAAQPLFRHWLES
jgi:hypothetical protein